MHMEKVFVYGTLRKHESNHGLLATAKPVAMQCRVEGRLYDTGGGYPAMALEPEYWTYGELYEVDDAQLSNLDCLEGYNGEGEDNLYDRVVVPVETDTGFIYAYAYIFLKDQVQGLSAVEFGDWRVSRFLNEKRVESGMLCKKGWRPGA